MARRFEPIDGLTLSNINNVLPRRGDGEPMAAREIMARGEWLSWDAANQRWRKTA